MKYHFEIEHEVSFYKTIAFAGVAYDSNDARIYWSDVFHKFIASSNLDGADFRTWNHSNIEKPEFLAIDYLGRNFYYSGKFKDHFSLLKYFLLTCKLESSALRVAEEIAQRGARTHDPEIKSLMLYRLS